MLLLDKMLKCVHAITGIILEAYSPLGSPGNPLFKGKEPRLIDDPTVKEIAEKHGVSCAQVQCVCIAAYKYGIPFQTKLAKFFPLSNEIKSHGQKVKGHTCSTFACSKGKRHQYFTLKRLKFITQNYHLRPD